MKLKIIVIPEGHETLEENHTLIDNAQHDLSDLWEEAEWLVERKAYGEIDE